MVSATETAAGAAAHYLAKPTTARPADGLGEAASAASSAVAVLTRAPRLLPDRQTDLWKLRHAMAELGISEDGWTPA